MIIWSNLRKNHSLTNARALASERTLAGSSIDVEALRAFDSMTKPGLTGNTIDLLSSVIKKNSRTKSPQLTS
jgi:hypothetical protein